LEVNLGQRASKACRHPHALTQRGAHLGPGVSPEGLKS